MKRIVFFSVVVLVCCVSLFSVEEMFAQLVGDGVADDTQAIQAMLDSGNKIVSLPPPVKHYVISKPLRIHSDQTLKLDAATVIRLADGSDNYMLVNADPDNGNKNIVISGGIWDGNNIKINHAKGNRNRVHPHQFFIGSVFLLMNIENLRVEKLTVKDPEKFGIHLGACRKFTVDGITFDYNAKEPNMDGVHLQGGCSEGVVTNIKGNTYDDMIALNADDGEYWEITQGAITDIKIDGVWATNCFRAVRFLSTGTPIKRISISNIFGSYFRNTIAFTHWRLDLTEQPRFEDIAINNIFTAKVTDKELLGKLGREDQRQTFAIIGIEGRLSFNHLTISNVFRTEWMPNAAPTIRVQQGTVIETLRLHNIQQTNMTDIPLIFFYNDASILQLFIDGVVIREKEVEKSIPTKGNGRVLHRHGDIVTYGEQELNEETNRANDEIRTNPQKLLLL
ncbi:MAG: hypothetical protein LBC02_03540 [Planctomycetaceae bacterium]|jgi:hypothetical protein|nr:hypothetical protein [Planctomycetaceae bacterium]